MLDLQSTPAVFIRGSSALQAATSPDCLYVDGVCQARHWTRGGVTASDVKTQNRKFEVSCWFQTVSESCTPVRELAVPHVISMFLIDFQPCVFTVGTGPLPEATCP